MNFHPVRLLILGTCLILSSCKPDEKPAAATKETAAPEATAADAFLVLPGDYAESTTAADLEARFGKDNGYRETEPEPRVVLFPDDPTRRAYVTFYEEETFEHLAGITVTESRIALAWHEGVHIGMTMAQVQALNRKPFYFFVDHEHRHGRAHDGGAQRSTMTTGLSGPSMSRKVIISTSTSFWDRPTPQPSRNSPASLKVNRYRATIRAIASCVKSSS